MNYVTRVERVGGVARLVETSSGGGVTLVWERVAGVVTNTARRQVFHDEVLTRWEFAEMRGQVMAIFAGPAGNAATAARRPVPGSGRQLFLEGV
jgi:hypothetical protein